jgi:hypothetical protein
VSEVKDETKEVPETEATAETVTTEVVTESTVEVGSASETVNDADALARSLFERGPIWRSAETKPTMIDPDSKRAEIVWTSGATVRRQGLFGDWDESLSLKPDAVRLDRMNSGAAPLLKNHDATDISNVIGVVERAWVSSDEGRAIVRFSDRTEVAGIFQDIQNGILRSVSVGYRVNKFEETTREGDDVRSFVATDWTPLEISVVPIPADAVAGFRAEIRSETSQGSEGPGERMENTKAPQMDSEAIKAEAIKAERARAAEITKAVRAAKLEETFANELIEKGVEIDAARAQIIEKLAAATTAKTESHVRVEVGTEAREHRIAGAESALLSRYNGRKFKLEERGHDFVGKSLVEIARDFVEASGVKTRGMSAGMIAERALHSTSDFPLLLANVAGKSLRDAYAEAPMTWMPLVREVELPDFKEVTRVQLGDAPSLEQVLESGEFKRGSLSEAKEAYKLGTYGKVVAVTRQIIVNDDLGAFTRVPALMARAAADLQSDMIWAILGQNATMGDGVALFHATHANLSASSDAISVDSIGAARAAMRKQVGLGGRLINVSPSFLIVPAAKETKAQQLVASVMSTQLAEVNPFSGTLQVIAEPRLDGYSSTAWYLMASPQAIDTIEVAYLSGERGPQVSTREGFDVDGVEIKVRLDFATKAIDHRGMFKNAGA